MASIKVIIDQTTGKTEIKAVGYAGSVCQQKTRPFEEALGRVTNDAPTPEMYNEQTQGQNQNQS